VEGGWELYDGGGSGRGVYGVSSLLNSFLAGVETMA
jgi:hypothetical protein